MAVNTFGIKPVYLLAGGAVLVALLWAKQKGAAGLLVAAGSGVVDVFGAAGSALYNVPATMAGPQLASAVNNSGLVGLPYGTDQTQCQKDQAAGDTWAASFSCPALDFLKYAL